MKRPGKVAIYLGLSGFFLLLASCSTVNNMWNWPRSLFFGGAVPKNPEFGQFRTERVRPGGNPDSHYLLACYHHERGLPREAIEEFEKVLWIDPNYVKAYNGLGISYDLLGNFGKAIELYERGLKLNPDLDYLQNNLGYSYLLQGYPDKAIAAFQKAIALNGKEGLYRNNLGLAYALNGQLELALMQFTLAGDESKANFNIAQFYYQRGLYDLAEIHFRLASSLHRAFARARAGLEATRNLAKVFQPPKAPEPGTGEGELVAKPAAMIEEAEPGEEVASAAQDAAQNTESVKSEALKRPVPSDGSKAAEKTAEKLTTEYEKKEYSNRLGKIQIEISNGNGINRMARRVGRYLKEKGFKVTRLTNASHFNHPQTRILYQGKYQDFAAELARQLPVAGSLEAAPRWEKLPAGVKLIIGKDLISHDRLFPRQPS